MILLFFSFFSCVKFCYLTMDMKLMVLENVDQKSVSDVTNCFFEEDPSIIMYLKKKSDIAISCLKHKKNIEKFAFSGSNVKIILFPLIHSLFMYDYYHTIASIISCL